MSVISAILPLTSKYLGNIFDAVEDVLPVKVETPDKTTVSSEEDEAKIELAALSDDGGLMVDESSKHSNDVTDTAQSSEQYSSISKVDITERAETNCTSAVNSVAQLPQRKRGRQLKTGLN